MKAINSSGLWSELTYVFRNIILTLYFLNPVFQLIIKLSTYNSSVHGTNISLLINKANKSSLWLELYAKLDSEPHYLSDLPYAKRFSFSDFHKNQLFDINILLGMNTYNKFSQHNSLFFNPQFFKNEKSNTITNLYNYCVRTFPDHLYIYRRYMGLV